MALSMIPNDPTTPLGDLPPQDQLTINRASPAPQRDAGGFAPGTTIADRYRIVALLGRGGMGAVYRADDLRLGQPVALKFVDLGNDALSVENLYHEVRVARQVSHPNVCRVHDVVEAEGHRFIAMEYVDGEDLASLLRRIGRLPAAKATEIAREIASGVAAAHEKGVIHRDLKPANVMIDGNGRAHITDFGLASLAGSDDRRIAGTPAYMAPEQVTGEPATPRSDVYALGLIMYELFTGERVYASNSYADRRSQRAASPRPASASVKEIEPAIDAVIAACLAEDPAKRPASARAVLAMLPGGDAIDAAMAAGETPSPEMVAAAAETGELPLHVAAVLFASIVAFVLLLSWQSQSYFFTLMRKPPDVFTDRASEIVTRAGEASETRDEVHFFDYDASLLRRGRSHPLPRARLIAMRPGIMQFVYRRSPQRMAPRETVQAANDIFIFESGRVTLDDPRLDVPGSAIVILDHHGSLVEYRALPSGRSATPNWRPLLDATGVDINSLVASAPAATPPVASDARAAWTAAFHGQSERVRIEAASLNGHPAWLRVSGPWQAVESASEMVHGRLVRASGVIYAVQLVLMIAFLIVAIVTTRRILRRGRSDRAGALRLSLYYGGCLFFSWLIATHHAIEAEDEARMFAAGLGEAAGSAAVLWFFYMALEPGVRRTWPRSLIGWTRLLAGRFRDALVGREILFGIAGGIVAAEGFWVVAAVRAWLQGGSVHFVKASAIDPLAVFIGDALISHAVSIALAIGTIFICLFSRMVFGRIGGFVAFGLLIAGYAYMSPAIGVYMVVLMLLLFRSGVLSGVAMGATLSLLVASPLTLDPGAWYWPRALAVLIILVAAAAWAARTTLGSRPRWASIGGDR
jgi:predicted Ser/Thr protein kinase